MSTRWSSESSSPGGGQKWVTGVLDEQWLVIPGACFQVSFLPCVSEWVSCSAEGGLHGDPCPSPHPKETIMTSLEMSAPIPVVFLVGTQHLPCGCRRRDGQGWGGVRRAIIKAPPPCLTLLPVASI